MVFILQSCWDSDVGKKQVITCCNLWSVTDYCTKNKAPGMDSNITCRLFLGLFIANTDTQSNFTVWGSYLFVSVHYILGRLCSKSWLDFSRHLSVPSLTHQMVSYTEPSGKSSWIRACTFSWLDESFVLTSTNQMGTRRTLPLAEPACKWNSCRPQLGESETSYLSRKAISAIFCSSFNEKNTLNISNNWWHYCFKQSLF